MQYLGQMNDLGKSDLLYKFTLGLHGNCNAQTIVSVHEGYSGRYLPVYQRLCWMNILYSAECRATWLSKHCKSVIKIRPE